MPVSPLLKPMHAVFLKENEKIHSLCVHYIYIVKNSAKSGKCESYMFLIAYDMSFLA